MEFNSEKDIMLWADQRMLVEYDDLIRKVRRICESDITESFYNFVEYHKRCRDYWIESASECKRLQAELEKTIVINTDLESKIVHARRLLETERKLRRECESEIDTLDRNMGLARELLFNDKRNKLANETLEKLQFLNNNTTRTKHRLSTITELNSTGSILSDISLSRSEDDLDLPDWQRHRSSINNDESFRKRRRTSSDRNVVEINANDRVIATTTLSVGKDGGPITATSIIEAVPEETPKKFKPSAPPQDLILEDIDTKSSLKKEKSTPQLKFRQHTFSSKPIIRPEKCSVCELRIGFGKTAVKCRNCQAVTHATCQHLLSLSCVPIGNTPTLKGGMGYLNDYVPLCPPMIPSLIVHCVNEVEHRGLNEVGLYRVPGSEKAVKSLKESFLRGKRTPNLSGIEIPVICCVIKDFLRSLKEPLITYTLWPDFVRAVESHDEKDIEPILEQIISELPRPNRDTLAYLMLHLQKIAERKECKMPISNLSKIFGPTIVGYSNPDVGFADLLAEYKQQACVVEHLLKLPSNYWESVITIETETPSKKTELKQTFSTESLSKPFGGFFTPSSSAKKQKRNFFDTPPKHK